MVVNQSEARITTEHGIRMNIDYCKPQHKPCIQSLWFTMYSTNWSVTVWWFVKYNSVLGCGCDQLKLYLCTQRNLWSMFVNLRAIISRRYCQETTWNRYICLRYCSGLVPCQSSWQASPGKAGHLDGLVQNYSNSSALAMELLQSCTYPSMTDKWRKTDGHSRCTSWGCRSKLHQNHRK